MFTVENVLLGNFCKFSFNLSPIPKECVPDNCGCLTREEVCQYPDALLVSDQCSSSRRNPGGNTHFPGSHRRRRRGRNKKASNCKLRVSMSSVCVCVSSHCIILSKFLLLWQIPKGVYSGSSSRLDHHKDRTLQTPGLIKELLIWGDLINGILLNLFLIVFCYVFSFDWIQKLHLSSIYFFHWILL